MESSSLVEARQLSSKRGTGLVAKQHISVGSTLLSEKPLLIMPSKVYELEDLRDIEVWLDKRINALSSKQREQFFELSDCRNAENKSALGIFFTNDMSFGKDTALCVNMARANHSCMPNADFFAREDRGVMELVALADIEQGEEICICYLPAANQASDVANVRQSYTRQWYGFQCDCNTCSLKGQARLEDDRVREWVRALQPVWRSILSLKELERFVLNLRRIGCKPDYELEVLRRFFELCVAQADFQMAAKVFAELFMLEAVVDGSHRDFEESRLGRFDSKHAHVLQSQIVVIGNRGYLFNLRE